MKEHLHHIHLAPYCMCVKVEDSRASTTGAQPEIENIKKHSYVHVIQKEENKLTLWHGTLLDQTI